MSSFRVDATSKPGILVLVLSGSPGADEMERFVAEHNRAIESYRGAAYRVFCDLRDMQPLSPDAAAHFQRAKEFSKAQPNFRGSAVLVASSTVAMQHRRTSLEGGVLETELICDSEPACWSHLRRVHR
ncbi:MAG: hypothetical protein ABW352_20620 [Polyangiales bacterium]